MPKKLIDVNEICRRLDKTNGVLDGGFRPRALFEFCARNLGGVADLSLGALLLAVFQLALVAALAAVPMLFRVVFMNDVEGDFRTRLSDTFDFLEWATIMLAYITLRLLRNLVAYIRSTRSRKAASDRVRVDYLTQKLNVFERLEKHARRNDNAFDEAFRKAFTKEFVHLAWQAAQYYIRPGDQAYLSVSFFLLKSGDRIDLTHRHPVKIKNKTKPREEVIAYYACHRGGSVVVNDFKSLEWDFQKFSENGGQYRSILSLPVIVPTASEPAIAALSIDSDRAFEFANARVRARLEDELAPYLNLLSRIWRGHTIKITAKHRKAFADAASL
jgi:hypothetical protein